MARCGLFTLLLLLATLFPADTVPAAHAGSPVAASLEAMLEPGSQTQSLCAGCSLFTIPAELAAFYETRSFVPLWVDGLGFSRLGSDLATVLKNADLHGLNPEEYYASCIASWADHFQVQRGQDEDLSPDDLAGVELLLGEAFLRFADHLAHGRVHPSTFDLIWVMNKERTDIPAKLAELAQHKDMDRTVRELAPPWPEYWDLVLAARELAAEQDTGWEALPKPEEKKIEPGDEDAVFIPLLRRHLSRNGYLFDEEAQNATRYDDNLVEGIKKFQRRHGMKDDGIIGPMTLTALNTSPEEIRRKVIINLERWRWLPRTFGDRAVLVNIPAYMLKAIEKGETVLEMKIICGQPDKQTPVFSKRIRYMEFNPFWNVPEKIALEELLPKIEKNPEYLAKNNYELVSTGENAGDVIDPETIDWENTNGTLPGRIRQNPGAGNALGRIKFMFPNSFDVYMHDTSSRYLFDRAYRALSHGCIRVQNPLGLAMFLLQDQPEWTEEKIQARIDGSGRGTIDINPQPLVQIMYITAVIGHDGRVVPLNDVYNQDDKLWKALTSIDAKYALRPGAALAVKKGKCDKSSATKNVPDQRPGG